MDGGGTAAKPEAAAPAFRERARTTSQEMPAIRLPGEESRSEPVRRIRPTPEAPPAPRPEEALRDKPAVPLDRDGLMRTRIKDLALHIAGTKVEKMVQQLYDELAQAGVSFHPPCYLSDEWGCPDGKPIIGLPFYLADDKLGAIEGEVNEVREDEKESMLYLRHEAGHAFCYAYELYNDEGFAALFGPFSRPYVEDYKVMPFSRSFVRHVPGWYAQKHPDEDFAETFAVFITPGAGWRQTYAGWPALRKLEYVEAKIKELGQAAPKVPGRAPELPDVPVELMEETVGEVFEREGPPADVAQQLGAHFDADLRQIFLSAGQGPLQAADVVEAGRKQLIPSVGYWTGLARPVVKAVVLHLIARCRELGLTARPGIEAECLARFSVLVTTLAMNRVYSGKFGEL
ncbi:MAG: hypothetical protein HY901_11945 [Deltaproteobacteria bacterium]|nr:hypothetical protein [Deltaproteobacteria bacterium]